MSGTEAAWTTDGPTDSRPTITLDSMPGLAGLYGRGIASSSRIAVGNRLPDVSRLPRTARDLPLVSRISEGTGSTLPQAAYRVAGVNTADTDFCHRLTTYQRLVREPVNDVIPAGFLHVLAFPLATGIMVRSDFPLPLVGLIHIRNRATQYRPVAVGDRVEVSAWAQEMRDHRRGTEVDIVTRIRIESAPTSSGTGARRSIRTLAYHGLSTYLARGIHIESGGESQDDGSAGQRPPFSPPLPTGRWALTPQIAKAYAVVSGDRNPIHTSVLGAKALGFPRTIAHGMYTAARALAEVGSGRGDTFDWSIDFAKPVLLPGTVDIAIAAICPDPGRPPGPAGWTFTGWSRDRLHFTGSVQSR